MLIPSLTSHLTYVFDFSFLLIESLFLLIALGELSDGKMELNGDAFDRLDSIRLHRRNKRGRIDQAVLRGL